MSNSINNSLSKLQGELDAQNFEYVVDDFKLKLKYHKKILAILEARDKILMEKFDKESLLNFYTNVFNNFEPLKEFFPIKEDNTYDFSFFKLLKVDYLDDLKMKVTLELFENKYIENTILEKTMHMLQEPVETTKVIWKDEKGKCPLIDFFENEHDDFESFDIFYEFYLNMFSLSEDCQNEE